MSKTAILEFDGKKYEFPVIVGSENEAAIDIEKLRALTGAITLDPGYKNSALAKVILLSLTVKKVFFVTEVMLSKI
jgi:citrate synthase